MLIAFLQELYFPDTFYHSRLRWVDIKRLALAWKFPHQAAAAVRKLLELQQANVPVAQRIMFRRFAPYEIVENEPDRQRLFIVQIEDDSIDNEESFVAVETT
jgi:hypothetical protein